MIINNGKETWVANSKVKITGVATTFKPTVENTKVLRLYSNVDCRILINSIDQVDADNNSSFLPAGTLQYVSIKRFGNLSVIKDIENGTLEITEITL